MWVFVVFSLIQGRNVLKQYESGGGASRRLAAKAGALLTLMEIVFHLTGEKHAIIQHLQAQVYIPLAVYQGRQLYTVNRKRFALFVMAAVASTLASLVDGAPFYTKGFDIWRSPGIGDPNFVKAHYVVHLSSWLMDELYTVTCCGGSSPPSSPSPDKVVEALRKQE